ncbi:MAG TPA: glycosyltransferase [Pyrinomonadaceae bacterium]|nr:glycosyltransferase [Pyrinomonadaceae bacterium]
MKKRILFVPSWYPSLADPIAGVFIEEQAVALSNDHDVAVLIPQMAAWRNVLKSNAPDRSVKKEQSGLAVYHEFARPMIPHGGESIDYDTFARAAENGFKKVVKEWGKPDIIHTHVVLPAGWSALGVGKRHGIPVVLTEHSSPFSMHLGTELSRRLVRETLTGVNQVIAISPALVNHIHEFQPELPIEVIGESLRTDFFVPADRVDNVDKANGTGKSFFVAARLAEQKGLSHLIDAVHLLTQKGMNSFEVVIGGDGPDRQKLEEQVQNLGVERYCRFLGGLNREQVRERMQKCDVFVLSSLHETFGVVVGEAMACGKPVISTRCGGPEFFVNDDNGVLVDVANAHALADAMADFINDRHAFNPDTVRASVVDRFSPEAFVRNVTAVYERFW